MELLIVFIIMRSLRAHGQVESELQEHTQQQNLQYPEKEE